MAVSFPLAFRFASAQDESIYLIKYFPAHPNSALKLPMKHSDFFFSCAKVFSTPRSSPQSDWFFLH
jgi:hypothetical protein